MDSSQATVLPKLQSLVRRLQNFPSCALAPLVQMRRRLSPPPPLTFIAQRCGHMETHRVWFLCPPPGKPDSPDSAAIFCSVPLLTHMSSAASVGSAFAASFQVTALALTAHSLYLQNPDTV